MKLEVSQLVQIGPAPVYQPTEAQLEEILKLRAQIKRQVGVIAVSPPLPVDMALPDEELYERVQNALDARDEATPGFQKLIREVREQIREICPLYVHCRQDDWCVFCNSGAVNPVTGEERFFRAEAICQACPLSRAG